jgi:cysteine desulfurase
MDTAAPIYLDYAATTPLDPAVIAAMTECLAAEGGRGNPASLHGWGRRASARIETARAEVAALIGAAAEDIVFTSGATESDNLAVLGAARAAADRGRHLVSTRIEHKAGLDPCRRLQKEGFAVTLLAPDRTGRIDPRALAAALRPETVLVSVMWVNNETGVIQDVEAIGALCRERGILFHTDAAQAVGKVPMALRELPIDLMSFTAHKLYGPKGIGALYVRTGVRARLQPLLYGGGQERGLRPGTLPTHQIVGFGAACTLARAALAHEPQRIAALRDRLWAQLEPLGGVHLNGGGAPRVAGLLNVSIEGVEGESLVTGLPDLAVSTGSACNSASAEPSYVLRALGRNTELAQSSLRFSLGRFSHPADIEAAAAAVRREVTRLRALSPALEPQTPVFAAQLVGEAGGPGQEVWIRFRLQVDAGRVRAATYRVYGCPHTMVAAAWLAEQVQGRAVADMVPGRPQEWAAALGIPAEKLGRLLTLEDALRECQRHGAAV